MLSSLALPTEIRVQLETARRILGLSQAELSEMAGMSQGNVSNCLQGRAVRIESLHRLVSAFAAAVASAADRGVPPEHAVELQKVIEAARKSVDGSSEPAVYLARPGGPMPENATNRIRRPEDQRLLAALDDAPFTTAVVGPPECGKSTLLQLLAAEARRRGFAVTEFDAAIILPPGYEEIADQDIGVEEERRLNEDFFGELAEEVGRTLGERPQERVRTRFDLSRFLKDTRLRRPAPPLLIVVDHASRITLALEELVQVCRTLDAQKSRTQMSWAIEASDLSEGHQLGALSRLAPSPLVELRWLTFSQVEGLADLYEVRDQGQVRELWNWFSGQPFLTHAAFTRYRDLLSGQDTLEEGAVWKHLISEIGEGEAELGRHLSRLRARLRQYSLWNQRTAWSKEVLIASCKKNPEFLIFVRQFGIVMLASSRDGAPVIVNFYRNHLSRL